MDTYDVVIVGSGTAGQTAAFDLSEKGVKIALAETAERPGGTCALAGCQPKKWFYEAAETIAKSRHLAGRGIVSAPEGSWTQVLEQKRQFTADIPAATTENLQNAGIDFVAGAAVFSDDNTLNVERVGLKHAAYKILVDDNHHILGAHILSDQASGIVNTVKQTMLSGTPVEELHQQSIVSPYPTRESDLSYMLKPLLSE